MRRSLPDRLGRATAAKTFTRNNNLNIEPRNGRQASTQVSPPSGVSGNVCRVDESFQSGVVGVAVAPVDVSADEAGLGGVVGVVGAGEGEISQRAELRLDAVQPGRVVRGVGKLDVVQRGPV